MKPKPESNQDHIAEVSKKVGHTPTPWRVQKKFEGPEVAFFAIGTKGWGVAHIQVGDMIDFHTQEANADLIIRAVNNYESLLRAVQMARGYQRLLGGDADERLTKLLDNAIAQAESEEGKS